MKKFKLFFLFLLAPFYLSAQTEYAQDYDYGSMMSFGDGTVGIIFYFDDTREHGLVFSTESKYPAKYVERKKNEAVKLNKKVKNLNIELDYSYLDEDILPQPTEEISEKKLTSIYKEIAPNLGDDGEKNMAEIVKFCEEKGLSMQNYFPEHYWAKSLGDGWYIPGNKELELIAELLMGGLGEKYYVKDALALTKRCGEIPRLMPLTRGLEIESNISMLASVKNYCRGIQSSTMKDAKKGFYSLVSVCNSKKGYRQWLELQEAETGESQIIAVRKF